MRQKGMCQTLTTDGLSGEVRPAFTEEEQNPNRCSDDSGDGVNSMETRMKGDPWRFAVAAIFCLLSISNAMQWIAFASIFDETRTYFNMTAVQVNYLATTYVIAYVVAVFLSCKLFEVTGLKAGILIAATANAIGASIKLVAVYAWPHMILLFLAQAFNSVTEILTIATPPLIANRWFPVEERVAANAVMTICLNVGCGLGALIPVFFVSPEKQEQRHFAALFWFQFGLCAGTFALTFIIPQLPRQSPSYAADRQQKMEAKRLRTLRERQNRQSGAGAPAETQPPLEVVEDDRLNMYDDDDIESVAEPINVFSTLGDTFRAMRTNSSFVFLSIASAAELGLIWSVATVLPQCLVPFGVTGSESGWISFLNLVLGSVIAPIVMHYFGQNWRHKQSLLVISIILVVNVCALCLCYYFGPSGDDHRIYYVVVVFLLWGGVAGLCQNFMLPIMFDFVVELTFPMRESTSAPVLTWAACLSNLVLTVVFGEVLGENPTRTDSTKVLLGTVIVCIIGCVALVLVRPLKRREEFEHRMEELDRAALQLPQDASHERVR